MEKEKLYLSLSLQERFLLMAYFHIKKANSNRLFNVIIIKNGNLFF
jgi:hypothetical protein